MNLRKVCALGLVAVGLFGFAGTAAAQTAEIVDAPVTKANGKKAVGTFNGTFTLTGFKAKGDQLLAVGTLDGVVTDADGNEVKSIDGRQVAIPVDLAKSGVGGGAVSTLQPGPGSCDVLNLVLGPLDLNLLGLEISLNQVVLDIVANPAGGLLGQILGLLCGLNLLDILGELLGSLNLLAGFLNLLALLSNLPF